MSSDSNSKIRLFDLIGCLSDAMDFIDPAVVNHHKQVASIAYRIGMEMGLPASELKDLVLAGALHDIGAFSLKERRDILSFEMEYPGLHAEKGFALLRFFKPLVTIAPLVRLHHLPWNRGAGAEYDGQQVPLACHILHLADRVAILIDKNREVLSQAPAICKRIGEEKDKMFMPRVVDAFKNLASKEYFWLDIESPSLQTGFSHRFKQTTIGLTSDDMVSFSALFSRIIDFKSSFTATHSSGVAAAAVRLSRLFGFTESECRLMLIAGHLHDLGKLAVPSEIIEKPSRLQESEFNVMRHHTYYTYRILETIPLLHVVNKWAAFHHERLDGSGYPFHLKARNIPRGSQIMAVADVFTAITEDRPYRRGMTRERAAGVLDRMARDSALSREIVAALNEHYDEINASRIQAQTSASTDYESLAVR